MAGLSPNGQQAFLRVCMAGLASTDRAAAEAADAIAAKEAQTAMPMDMPAPKRASIKSVEDRIDRLGGALQPLFRDGPFKAPEHIDPDEARRCLEKLRLVMKHMRQIEGEITRAASVAVAA